MGVAWVDGLEAELGLAVLSGRKTGAKDVEDAEFLERWLEEVEARAGVRDDEVLEDGVECEVAGTGSQEWERGRRLAEDFAVEAVLLALLADDRANTTDQLVVTVISEDGLDVWESAEDDIGELRGESDGVIEVVDRELVLAWLDRLAGELIECAVGVELVELFLRQDDLERGEHLLAVGDLVIAGNVVRDV